MEKVNIEEMRSVTGGRWKCNKCKKTYPLWISLWAGHAWNCIPGTFTYKWVL